MKSTLKTVFNLVIGDTPVTVWADTDFTLNDSGKYNYFVKVTKTSKLPKSGNTAELNAIIDNILETLAPNSDSTFIQF